MTDEVTNSPIEKYISELPWAEDASDDVKTAVAGNLRHLYNQVVPFMQFNGLRADEAELLFMLAEEAAEIVQVVNKILRHGYNSHHPQNERITNRQLLENEIGDFLGVLSTMKGRELNSSNITNAKNSKMDRARPYLHHQG